MEIRQNLEANFLTCKYCRQAYRKPKVLVCLHTFCQECLEQLVAQKNAELEAKELEAAKRYYASTNLSSDYKGGYRKKWSSKFRYGAYDSANYGVPRYTFSDGKSKCVACPLCEKETAIPAGGVAELPTDQLADRLASMVDRMPTFPICDVCTKQPLLENGAGRRCKDSRNLAANGHANDTQTCTENESNSSSEGDSFNDSESTTSGRQLFGVRRNGKIASGGHKSRLRAGEANQSVKRHRPQTVSGTSNKESKELTGPRPASAACLDCSKRLCTACRDTHTKMPVTSNHVLIRVEQMEDIRCGRHPRELRRFFCLTCRENICIVCTFDSSAQSSGNAGHSDHEIMSIREAVSSYQNQLSKDSATTQSHINQIETLLSSLLVCEQEMKQVYAAIDMGAKAFIDQINKQQRQLKDKVDQLAGVPLEVLSGECKRLNSASNEWYEFLNDDRITSRLDLMDPLEALREAGPMLDRVRGCLQAASEPLNAEMARQSFLLHLKTAESSAMAAEDSGLVSGQSSSSPKQNDACDNRPRNQRSAYWRVCLGSFRPGCVDLGRIMTDKELAAENMAEQSRIVNTSVQTGPELIKSLPPPKGAQRHRAIQVTITVENMQEHETQTEPISISSSNKVTKVDMGTQYVSADVNPPISMYRSLKQILVQK